MDSTRAVELLQKLLKELEELPRSYMDPAFMEWRRKTSRTLVRVFNEEHTFVQQFDQLAWANLNWDAPSTPQEHAKAFDTCSILATTILRTAIFELEELAEPVDFVGSAAIDPELWEHVRQDVETERWGQVASQTAIFVEDKVRQWAGRPNAEIGERLMTAVFGDGGEFPLGQVPGERQGWHRLAMGFAMAIRNVATHRIQQRPDDKRYAMGVLGTASLLLTQLRYEHSNRFRT